MATYLVHIISRNIYYRYLQLKRNRCGFIFLPFSVFQTEEKKKMFRKYPYFKLEVHIIKGEGLLAMDRGGKI